MSSFKKNPTIEELQTEIAALQEQLVNLNARHNALQRINNNHPAVIELASLKSKWFVKLFNWK